MEIRLAGVTKIYGADMIALEDVYLNIDKGEFVYLVGATGSGKTTLLRLITREIVPTRGQIVVARRNIRSLKNSALPYYRRELGVVFQDYRLLQHLTIMENVSFVLEATGTSPRVVRDLSSRVIDSVGLWRLRDHYPQQLSGGEQQRLAIARAMVNSPSVFIADEPTGNLDLHTSEDIMKLLLSINASGTTVLVATHDQYLVDAYRQRVVELDKGRVKRDERRGRYFVDDEF